MNDIPKVVFTQQTGFVPSGPGNWATARVADGDLVDEAQRLKEEGAGYVLAQGGAGFARSLVSLNLIDEYRIVIHPIALGTGIPLFADLSKPMDLELVSTTTFSAGAIANVYAPADR
jgi:dihydrofolate reductase